MKVPPRIPSLTAQLRAGALTVRVNGDQSVRSLTTYDAIDIAVGASLTVQTATLHNNVTLSGGTIRS